jgi:hypothetical protein
MASSPLPEKHWHWLLAVSAVTVLALALRWYYVSTAVVLNPVRGDATQYFAYAWNLIHHGIFAKTAPGAAVLIPDSYRDPGYPAFLALWMKALGTGNAWYAAVLLCQALLGALTVTVATQLGRHWLPMRWAIAAGLLMAIWPHSITITGYLLTETLFGFLCALGLLLIARGCVHGNTGWALAGGFVLGAAALTNAVLLPFGVLLAGFLAWRKLASRKVCVALAIGALLLPGAWTVRNLHIPPPAAGSTSKDRALQNFVQGAWPGFHTAYRDSIFGDAATRSGARVTLHAVKEEIATFQASFTEGGHAVLRRFSQAPLHYVGWYLFGKPHELWDWAIVIGQGDIYVYPTRNSPFQTSPPWIALAAVCRAMNMMIMLLALASLLVVWRRNVGMLDTSTNRAALISVICLLAFATAVYATLQAEPRYSVPFRPFEMLLAVTTLYGLARWWRHQKHAIRQTTHTSARDECTEA